RIPRRSRPPRTGACRRCCSISSGSSEQPLPGRSGDGAAHRGSAATHRHGLLLGPRPGPSVGPGAPLGRASVGGRATEGAQREDRKSTRLNSSHVSISYAVFCLKKKKKVREERN